MPRGNGDVWTGVSYSAASHALRGKRKLLLPALGSSLSLRCSPGMHCPLPERTRVIPTSGFCLESAWDTPLRACPKVTQTDRLTGQQGEAPVVFLARPAALPEQPPRAAPQQKQTGPQAGHTHSASTVPPLRAPALRPCRSQKEPPSRGLSVWRSCLLRPRPARPLCSPQSGRDPKFCPGERVAAPLHSPAVLCSPSPSPAVLLRTCGHHSPRSPNTAPTARNAKLALPGPSVCRALDWTQPPRHRPELVISPGAAWASQK